MKYFKFLALVMLVFLVVGCGTKDPVQPTTAKMDIMPLKLGIIWTYDFEFYEPGSPGPSYIYEYTVELLGQSQFGGQTWYRARHFLTDGNYSDSSFWYYTLKDSGLYVTIGESQPVYLKIKYPAAVDDIYEGFNETMYRIFYLGVYPTTIVSTNESTTVPAGTYTCYHSRMNIDGEAFQHEYYSPNVGMVRSELLIFDGMQYQPYVILKLKQFQVL